jgi:hypothetical protein
MTASFKASKLIRVEFIQPHWNNNNILSLNRYSIIHENELPAGIILLQN